MNGRIAAAGVALWLAGAGLAQAAGAHTSLALENHSSRRIEGVTLGSPVNAAAPGWKAEGFMAERDGGDVRLGWLTPHMRGRAIFPAGARARCVFDVTVTMNVGTVRRRGLNLCRGAALVIDEGAIVYPPSNEPPPPPIVIPFGPHDGPPPSPPLTPPGSSAWALLGSEHGGRYFFDPGSIAGGRGDRRATVKIERPGGVEVQRYSVNCERWLYGVLSDIDYDAKGAQVDSIDWEALAAAGRRTPRPGSMNYGSVEDTLAVKLCQGLPARLR